MHWWETASTQAWAFRVTQYLGTVRKSFPPSERDHVLTYNNPFACSAKIHNFPFVPGVGRHRCLAWGKAFTQYKPVLPRQSCQNSSVELLTWPTLQSDIASNEPSSNLAGNSSFGSVSVGILRVLKCKDRRGKQIFLLYLHQGDKKEAFLDIKMQVQWL